MPPSAADSEHTRDGILKHHHYIYMKKGAGVPTHISALCRNIVDNFHLFIILLDHVLFLALLLITTSICLLELPLGSASHHFLLINQSITVGLPGQGSGGKHIPAPPQRFPLLYRENRAFLFLPPPTF